MSPSASVVTARIYRLGVVMAPLYLLFSALLHAAATGCRNSSVGFERLSEYDDVDVLNINVSLNFVNDVDDVLVCADACALNSSCVVFYHNPATSSCILYPSVMIPIPDTGLSTPGSRYYERRLPPGWCTESEGWVQDGTTCYSLSEGQASWTVAKQACEDKGGQLMMFKDLDKKNLVVDIANRLDLYHTNVWIGMSDIETEGVFKWIDGTTLSGDFWTSYQPNGGNTENCAMLLLGGICDSVCENENKYLCEKLQS
ncbi:uncharacterized protein [Haliotis asinina]|uniref:uncharacterized protein n=1 Tax=Haliotis asinina TaxID=109174 RepID=UPI003531CAB8